MPSELEFSNKKRVLHPNVHCRTFTKNLISYVPDGPHQGKIIQVGLYRILGGPRNLIEWTENDAKRLLSTSFGNRGEVVIMH